MANDAADPRVQFAAERTLLAWVRTGLALMGFGFVVARFGLFLREMAAARGVLPDAHPTLSLWIGTALVALGVLVTFGAAGRHARTVARLSRGETLAFGPMALPTVIALLVGAMGLLLAAYLVVGSGEPAAKPGGGRRPGDSVTPASRSGPAPTRGRRATHARSGTRSRRATAASS